MEEATLRKLAGFDLNRVNSGFVPNPVVLDDLLKAKHMAIPSRDGSHEFDAEAVRSFADALPFLMRHRLRVPITVWEPHDLTGDGYVEDAVAQEALAHLGEGMNGEGKRWLSPIAVRRMRTKYPTVFQRLLL